MIKKKPEIQRLIGDIPEFTPEELIKDTSKLKNRKAPELDQRVNEVLRVVVNETPETILRDDYVFKKR